MERRFKRTIDSLDQIFEFLNEFVTANKIDESVTFTLNLVVEELFTNMVKYHSESREDILINATRDGSTLIVSLVDFDVEPFDVTITGEVNVNQALRDRKIGGLGIHLVKKMVDNLNYEYANRRSRITFTKNLEK